MDDIYYKFDHHRGRAYPKKVRDRCLEYFEQGKGDKAIAEMLRDDFDIRIHQSTVFMWRAQAE